MGAGQKYIMKNYIILAELHNLSIAADDEIDVLARLTIMLTMYAIGIY